MSSLVSRKPIISFDNSAINRLAREQDFSALAAGITTAYSTRVTGSNLSELGATPESETRDQLLNTCQRLLASGDCIDPFNWIVEKHTRAFDQDPKLYDWRKIDVHNRAISEEITRRTFFNDELAGLEDQSARETQETFEETFGSKRESFDTIFSNGTVVRPSTFADFVQELQKPSGAFWTGYGRLFYERSVTNTPDEARVRAFAGRCPPFLMMILAATMAQYKRVIVETPRKKKRAGRVDLLTSVYLPYCRVFVTHDNDQGVCLREMAAVANLETEVLRYDDFLGRLLARSIQPPVGMGA